MTVMVGRGGKREEMIRGGVEGDCVTMMMRRMRSFLMEVERGGEKGGRRHAMMMIRRRMRGTTVRR